MRPINILRKKQLMYLVEQKLTRKEIAEKMGLAESTISGMCRKFGINANFRKINYERAKKEIEEKYDFESSVYRNSLEINHSFNTIKRVMQEKGIKPKKYISKEDKLKIMEALKSGEKASALAAKYHVTRQRIYMIKDELKAQEGN